MTSEWEKLEELSKDELIIELMHWKTLYSILRNEQDGSCPMPELERSDAGSGFEDFDPGEVTTDRWAERIALFAIAHWDDSEFWPCDLMDYGLTDQQSYVVCKRLLDEGRLDLPDGVVLRGIRACVGNCAGGAGVRIRTSPDPDRTKRIARHP